MDYGDWLNDSGRWDWWFTGTFEYDASLGTARRAANSFTQSFDPVKAAWAIESRDRWQSEHRGSNVHLHGLIELGEDSRPPSDAEHWWESRFGFAAVKRFDPDQGAGHYVAKYAAKEIHQDRSSWNLYRGGEEGPNDQLPF